MTGTPPTPATLTDHELAEYDQAGDRDREWFARRPGRQYRLRPAAPSERKVLAHEGPVTHVLVHRFHEHGRLRRPVLWTIPGPTPDDDRVLARLAAGVPFTGCGGHA